MLAAALWCLHTHSNVLDGHREHQWSASWAASSSEAQPGFLWWGFLHRCWTTAVVPTHSVLLSVDTWTSSWIWGLLDGSFSTPPHCWGGGERNRSGSQHQSPQRVIPICLGETARWFDAAVPAAVTQPRAARREGAQAKLLFVVSSVVEHTVAARVSFGAFDPRSSE